MALERVDSFSDAYTLYREHDDKQNARKHEALVTVIQDFAVNAESRTIAPKPRPLDRGVTHHILNIVILLKAAKTRTPASSKPFRLLDLSPELRDQIYYQAMAPHPPIRTSAIPRTPEYVTIPTIAQLSRRTRAEALRVFYRNRTIEISFHCRINVDRALAWAYAWPDQARFLSRVVLSGKLPSDHDGDFFQVIVRRAPEPPFFGIHWSPFRTVETLTERAVMRCTRRLLLGRESADMARVARERRIRLSPKQFKSIILAVRRNLISVG